MNIFYQTKTHDYEYSKDVHLQSKTHLTNFMIVSHIIWIKFEYIDIQIDWKPLYNQDFLISM